MLDLEKRITLLNSIGSAFNNNFELAVSELQKAIKDEKFIFFCGNGGSAAESQHMSAEYIATLDHKRFRKGAKAISLTVDTSFLTAWTNDFGFEEVFSRQLDTLGSSGDILFAYSTSGNSPNIISVAKKAKEKQIKVLGFTGNEGGKLAALADISFIVPSSNTALIQEVHTILGHDLCFGGGKNFILVLLYI